MDAEVAMFEHEPVEIVQGYQAAAGTEELRLRVRVYGVDNQSNTWKPTT
jgi:hypothetical protein